MWDRSCLDFHSDGKPCDEKYLRDLRTEFFGGRSLTKLRRTATTPLTTNFEPKKFFLLSVFKKSQIPHALKTKIISEWPLLRIIGSLNFFAKKCNCNSSKWSFLKWNSIFWGKRKVFISKWTFRPQKHKHFLFKLILCHFY